MVSVRVSALHRYPLKSGRGEAVDRARVEAQGWSGDRRWMVVDQRGLCLTARQHPRLVLVTAELRPDGLRLRAPDRSALDVATPDPSRSATVEIWRDVVGVLAASAESDAWLSDHLGAAVRLVYQHDPRSRPVGSTGATAADRVSLADGYPVLLATEESLAALGRWEAERRASEGAGPEPVSGLDMRRFRPNLVVAGAPPFAEDGWRRIRVGPATFRVAKGCRRCVLTTVDPDTGSRGREPLRTLARHRRTDRGLWFGMNLLPELSDRTVGSTISVGDPVEVLE